MKQRVKQLAITERSVKMKKDCCSSYYNVYFFDNNFGGRK